MLGLSFGESASVEPSSGHRRELAAKTCRHLGGQGGNEVEAGWKSLHLQPYFSRRCLSQERPGPILRANDPTRGHHWLAHEDVYHSVPMSLIFCACAKEMHGKQRNSTNPVSAKRLRSTALFRHFPKARAE
eukprot:scaffold1234_cov248-Pinguiococcus_pyrenoidosus.AAC.21